jgi:hypothetical protein
VRCKWLGGLMGRSVVDTKVRCRVNPSYRRGCCCRRGSRCEDRRFHCLTASCRRSQLGRHHRHHSRLRARSRPSPSLLQRSQPLFVPIAPHPNIAVVQANAAGEPRHAPCRPLVGRRAGHTKVAGNLTDAEPAGLRSDPTSVASGWHHLASLRHYHLSSDTSSAPATDWR